MEFSYTVTGQSVRIDKVEEPESIVVIPEEMEGFPVTELGAYALSRSAVEEIHLPSGLKKIGAYAFYSCEKLKRIYCYGRILDLGAGLFADVPDVEFLDITLFDGGKSCFKEMLSELRQTLRVRVHMENGREARLIFPEYYEESVENTPARILFIETHGCGHRYRYCFINREFQYRGYDDVFPHVKVQESEALVTELALGRLLYPYGLIERYEAMYREYVKEHWKMAGQLMIGADGWKQEGVTNLDAGGVRWLAEQFLETGEQVSELIELAQKAGDTEAVSWLMDFRHRKFAKNDGGTGGSVDAAIAADTFETKRRKRRFEL